METQVDNQVVLLQKGLVFRPVENIVFAENFYILKNPNSMFCSQANFEILFCFIVLLFQSEFKSFHTLPPIRFENPVKLPSNRSRLIRHQEATAKNEWIRPQIPDPFIAHLCVTARTHDIAQYRIHFSKDNKKQFIDRLVDF